MKRNILCLFLLISITPLFAKDFESNYKFEEDILYRNLDSDGLDSYVIEKCRLDIYYPENARDFPTVVWFHGGGLCGDDKYISDELKKQGIAVVSVNYRLHPKVSCPVYIDDAAAAVAWAFKNIDKYNGNPDLIFVSGHSAGGYLASMICLDKSYLAKYGIDANRIAGIIPFSAHTITHFTVRAEREIPAHQAIIDKYAPLYHVRTDAPPLVLITGDRNLDMPARYEENALLKAMMDMAGHKETTLFEMKGCNHAQMMRPAYSILLNHIRGYAKNKTEELYSSESKISSN